VPEHPSLCSQKINLTKAILLKEYGLPNLLKIRYVAKPVSKENEVLVRGKSFFIRFFFGNAIG